MTLSTDCVLRYVLLSSGVVGHLVSGRVEHEAEGLMIYDTLGRLNEYISGSNLRSWCVIRAGVALPEWSHILPEDSARLTGR